MWCQNSSTAVDVPSSTPRVGCFHKENRSCRVNITHTNTIPPPALARASLIQTTTKPLGKQNNSSQYYVNDTTNLTHREVEALVPHRLRSALGRLRDARGVAHGQQAHRVGGRACRVALQRLRAFNAPPHVFDHKQKMRQRLTRIGLTRGEKC